MVFGEFVEVEIACTVDFLVVDEILLLIFRVVVAGFFAAAVLKYREKQAEKLHQLVVGDKNYISFDHKI